MDTYRLPAILNGVADWFTASVNELNGRGLMSPDLEKILGKARSSYTLAAHTLEKLSNGERPCPIVEDRHIIAAVHDGNRTWTTEEGEIGYRADRIIAYTENGSMAPLPWLAVYRDGEILTRLPASAATIRYVPFARTSEE